MELTAFLACVALEAVDFEAAGTDVTCGAEDGAAEDGSAAEGAALLGGDFGTCKFTVERAEKQGEGYRVLLSCNQRVEAVAMVRRLTVKILSD